MDSWSNILLYNNISTNGIGIHLSNSSKDNIAYYNEIRNNTAFGIHVAEDGQSIDAANNWWGDARGPHHLFDNFRSEGDNITDLVLFRPWLDEPLILDDDGTDAKNDRTDYFHHFFLSSLVLFLVSLVVLLVIVVCLPGKRRTRKVGADSAT